MNIRSLEFIVLFFLLVAFLGGLMFYVLLEIISLTLELHHCWCSTEKFRVMPGAYMSFVYWVSKHAELIGLCIAVSSKAPSHMSTCTTRKKYLGAFLKEVCTWPFYCKKTISHNVFKAWWNGTFSLWKASLT